jgi:hypothetical protein
MRRISRSLPSILCWGTIDYLVARINDEPDHFRKAALALHQKGFAVCSAESPSITAHSTQLKNGSEKIHRKSDHHISARHFISSSFSFRLFLRDDLCRVPDRRPHILLLLLVRQAAINIRSNEAYQYGKHHY